MSLIAAVAPSAARGRIAEIYGEVGAALGRVPNAFTLLGASPTQLDGKWRSMRYYDTHPHLGDVLRTAIRLGVARGRACAYCIGVNEWLLLDVHGWSADQVAALKDDLPSIPLPLREQAMLRFALSALDNPHAVSAADIADLRGHGWSEGDILDALCYAGEALVSDLLIDAFKVEMEVF